MELQLLQKAEALAMRYFLFFSFLLAFFNLAYAHCPLCAGAIGAAAVSANYFGVDPSIVGAFAGALGLSMGLWIAGAVKKDYIKFQKHIIILASFLFTLIPLVGATTEVVYLPVLLGGPLGFLNKVYFIDKLVLGALAGSVSALVSYRLHLYIKNRRGVLFPYQGVAFTVVSVAAASGTLYLLFG